MLRTVLAFVLVVLSPTAMGKAYKCTDADGNVTFQQVPCPAETEQDVPLILKPATLTNRENFDAEAYRLGMTPDELRAALAREQQRTGFRSSAPAVIVDPYAGQQPPARHSNGQGFRGTSGQSATTATSNPCPDGQVPANQSRHNVNEGFSSSKGYTTLKCVDPREQAKWPRAITANTDDPESTRRLRDDQGNTYTLPPGSSYATDDRTGKQCFVFGAFIKCD